MIIYLFIYLYKFYLLKEYLYFDVLVHYKSKMMFHN